MRTIGVVTVGRSDYGIYLPLINHIQNDPELSLNLIVGGMHLSSKHGLSVQNIKKDGFIPTELVKMLDKKDSPEGIAKSIGQGVIAFSKVYARFFPDILVVLGDRFEMFSAATAALPFNIPIAHIHGGEITKGAIDDALRHSITKFSHLHFVSTKEYAKRVIQLGEEPWRVILTGALGLDNLDSISILSQLELEKKLGIDLNLPTLIVTFHSVTLEPELMTYQIQQLLDAIDRSSFQSIFSMPNADTGSAQIIKNIKKFVSTHDNSRFIYNLGTQVFFSLMKYSAAMVGNSSSGIIEAPSFKLPVVNIGIRQEGRLQGKNVINVPCESNSILMGIQEALSAGFRANLINSTNPYKQGNASEIIINKLKYVTIDKKLLVKSFHDL